jgi:hypothetical protein
VGETFVEAAEGVQEEDEEDSLGGWAWWAGQEKGEEWAVGDGLVEAESGSDGGEQIEVGEPGMGDRKGF